MVTITPKSNQVQRDTVPNEIWEVTPKRVPSQIRGTTKRQVFRSVVSSGVHSADLQPMTRYQRRNHKLGLTEIASVTVKEQ